MALPRVQRVDLRADASMQRRHNTHLKVEAWEDARLLFSVLPQQPVLERKRKAAHACTLVGTDRGGIHRTVGIASRADLRDRVEGGAAARQQGRAGASADPASSDQCSGSSHSVRTYRWLCSNPAADTTSPAPRHTCDGGRRSAPNTHTRRLGGFGGAANVEPTRLDMSCTRCWLSSAAVMAGNGVTAPHPSAAAGP